MIGFCGEKMSSLQVILLLLYYSEKVLFEWQFVMYIKLIQIAPTNNMGNKVTGERKHLST